MSNFPKKSNGERRRSVISGSSLAIVQMLVRLLIGFLSVPITINYLGNERYGLWRTALSLITFISVFDASIAPQLKNRMSEAFAEGDEKKFKYYSSNGILLSLFLFIIGLIISIFVANLRWDEILNVHDVEAAKEASGLVFVLMIFSFASVATSSLETIYDARMDFLIIRVYSIISSVLSFVILLISVRFQVGLVILALVNTSGILLYRIFVLVRFLLIEPGYIIPTSFHMLDLVKEICSESILFLGIRVLGVILSSIPNFLIARYIGLNEVTTFSVTYQLISIPLLFISSVMPIIWPVFTIAWHKGEYSWLIYWIRNTLIIIASLMSIYGLTMMLFGENIIYFWTQGKVRVTVGIIALISVLVLIQCFLNFMTTFLNSIRHIRIEFWSYLVSVMLLLLFFFILNPFSGMEAMILSMIASLSLACLMPFSIHILRVFVKRNQQSRVDNPGS